MKSIMLVSDLNCGGAAAALRRLRLGLTRCQHIRTTWVHCSLSQANEISLVGWPPYHVDILRRLLQGLPRVVDRLGYYGNSIALGRFVARFCPDIINLHNMHQVYHPVILGRLPASVPTVWTLHDMWPLTGYCCYSFDCRKYEHGCRGACPQADQWGPMFGGAEEGWKRREVFFRKAAAQLVFVSPSRWLAGCVRSRLPTANMVRVVPYGIPLDTYRSIGDQRSVRVALGLPVEGKIVMCGSMVESRKGAGYLVQADKQLRAKRRGAVTVVMFGGKPKDVDLPKDWICVGPVRDEALLNLYYNAADVFVLPSLADNLPNTLIEATAAGTPCVTFDVGGCPEIVRDGETGFVARPEDETHLAECIERVLDMNEERRQQMSEACRRVAVAEYDDKLQAQRYLKLFEEMVSRRESE